LTTVRPFQGIRYNPQRVDLVRVLAPPYDVITPQDQRRYYEQDPRNVVRLIAGEVRPSDSPDDNKYTRAATFFNKWLNEGVLEEEPTPSLYLYRHDFVDPTDGRALTRVGLLGVVELEPFGSSVLPHERTHARAKADRLSLTRAVGANLSPVFALYEDAQSAVARIIVPTLREPPMVFVSAGDEQHTVWRVRGDDHFRDLARVFKTSRLYIADGHHRYETALNFRNRQRLDHPEAPPDAAFNFVLMLLVDVKDPGLVILPTHRILHELEGFDGEAFLRRLRQRQAVVDRKDRAALLAAMREPATGHRIGVALGEGRQVTIDFPATRAADPVSNLDVSILHQHLLGAELGVEENMLAEERYLSYSRDVDATLDRVEAGRAQAAFLLRPPAVSDVVAVAQAGQVMPQKSTYFFPKPASGIVFNPLDPSIRIRPFG
jgi:uncharacterized protein (DUF1015 family)